MNPGDAPAGDPVAVGHLTVDGRRVPAKGTLLHSCQDAGADVPYFCHDESVSSGGHCRSCIVEMDGRPVAACTTAAQAGAVVHTDSERIRVYRRDLGELMLAESSPGGPVATRLASWGATGGRYRATPRPAPSDSSHVYLRFDLNACIKCRLCESTCDQVQGQFVYGFHGRGEGTRLDWGATPFSDTPCVSCGACAAICPTGAISDRDRQKSTPVRGTVRTTCGYCGVGCQLDVHVDVTDSVHHIDGAADSPVNAGHLCVKGRYAHAFSRHPERLNSPLIRKAGVLVPASWDEAIATVAAEFGRLRGRVGGLSSARCTNEENYLLQKWMRAGLGTNDVDCCARVCHGPSAVGMRRVFGTGAATNSLADLDVTDCLLVSGSNTTEAHPVSGARIRARVLQGGAKLVVIDPRRTELARLADVHLALRPGTNVPLLHSLAYALIQLGLVDHAFVQGRTEGFGSYVEFLRPFAPELAASITGVPARLVWEAARLYGTAKCPMQAHGLGMTEHFQGSESVMLLCNLALLVGAIGRRGVGVNPLRGQNNVQGAADMGCQPDFLTGYQPVSDSAVRNRIESIWGRPVPPSPGRTIPQMYEAIVAGEIGGLFILGEDVVQTDPACHVNGALDKLSFLVVQELFLTDTAKRADVVLPGASFLEKEGTFTNGERRVQRVRPALAPVSGSRPDWRILLDLMAATGLPQDFASPTDVLAEIAKVAPLFAGLSAQRLDGDGLQWPVPHATHTGTTVLHRDSFHVGRAQFAEIPFVPSPSLDADVAKWPLRLVTGRRLEHYNCGSMTRRSPNLDLAPHDALQICAEDAVHFGLRDGELAQIESPWGAAIAAVAVTSDVAKGTCFLTFHFAGTSTNNLISPVLDRLADCPEYKLTPVRVRPDPP